MAGELLEVVDLAAIQQFLDLVGKGKVLAKLGLVLYVLFLAGIRRPALLINAKDAPFFPGAYLPGSEVAANRFLTAEFTARGGYVGFLTGFWPGRPVSWAEQRAILFLREQL